MALDALLEEFRAAGLPVAASQMATSPVVAGRAAQEVGLPVVLKACGLDHKTELGGVIVGLATPEAVESAARRMQQDIGPAAHRLLVQRHLHGFEVLIGVRREEEVGAAILVGGGGILTELLADTATALLPLEPGDARSLLIGLRIAPVLTGYRGLPHDLEALVELVEHVAKFAEERPDIGELDLNPVIVGRKGEGVTLVDARLVRTDHPIQPTPASRWFPSDLNLAIQSGPCHCCGRIR